MINSKLHQGAPKRERRRESIDCGIRVRDHILRMDGTVAEIARALGISETQVRNIRNDGQIPTMDAVYAIAKHAKIPAEHFLVGPPADTNAAFAEQVYAMASEVPASKRVQLIKMLDAFCEAVLPPD